MVGLLGGLSDLVLTRAGINKQSYWKGILDDIHPWFGFCRAKV